MRLGQQTAGGRCKPKSIAGLHQQGAELKVAAWPRDFNTVLEGEGFTSVEPKKGEPGSRRF